MASLRFSLISDGSSDKALLPVLKWLLRRCDVQGELAAEWVDWGRFREPPRTLTRKIQAAVRFYPCELLFIHRDAETAAHGDRRAEIQQAIQVAGENMPAAVCIVPVRMMEAWFLFSEQAIREASGNPSGREPLTLPRTRDIETLPDPKLMLHNLLRDASGLSGRRLKSFRVAPAIHRMADIIGDFGPLLELPAFAQLSEDLRSTLRLSGIQTR